MRLSQLKVRLRGHGDLVLLPYGLDHPEYYCMYAKETCLRWTPKDTYRASVAGGP